MQFSELKENLNSLSGHLETFNRIEKSLDCVAGTYCTVIVFSISYVTRTGSKKHDTRMGLEKAGA